MDAYLIGKLLKRSLSVAMLTLVGMAPFSVFALGVGGIDLESALNQPLEARIEVLGAEPNELESLTVALASNDVYERMGIERNAVQDKLNFRIAQNDDGDTYIRVFSTEAINEPFLNFLVEVNWASGRLLREFTVLLDPPVFDEEAAKPVESPETGAPPEVVVADPQMEVVSPPPVVARTTEELATQPLAEGVDYGPVKRGDNLWKIASSIKPVDVSLQQVMLALYRENPEAFYGNNASMLKEGAVLRLDNIDVARRISVDEAMAEMARQHRDWMAHRRERAASRAIASETVGDRLHGEQAPADVDPATKVSDEPVLKLVTPSAEESLELGIDGSIAEKLETELNAAKIELTMANELLEATRKENADLQGRISSLESQLTAMNNLIELRDKEMQLTQDQPADDKAQQPAVELDTGDEGVAPETEQPVEQEEKSILEDPLTIGTIVGVIVLLMLFFIIVLRNRDGGSKNQFQDEAIFEDTASVEKEGMTKAVAEASDLGFGTSEPVEEEEFIDPASEADVYIAYGKYDKAEELLLPAIERNPDRHELKLKLLEVYSLAGNKADFDTAAEEFYAAIGGDKTHALWGKAAEFAADVSPDNGLFDGFAGSQESVFGGESDEGLTDLLQVDDAPSTEPHTKERQPGDDTFAYLENDLLLDREDSTQIISKDLTPAPESDDLNISSLDMDNIEMSGMETVDSNENATEALMPASEVDEANFIAQDIESTPQASAFIESPASNFGSSAASGDIPQFGVDTSEPAVTEHGLTSMLENFDEPEIGDTEKAEMNDALPDTEILDVEQDLSVGELETVISMPEDTDTEIVTVGYSSAEETILEPEHPEMVDATQVAVEEEVVSEIEDIVAQESDTESVTATLSDMETPESMTETAEEVSDIFAEDSSARESDEFDDTTMFLLADEVGTKLDLARAYIEMGDKDGAVELLKEVQAEGDAKQKADAKELLSLAG